MLILNLFTVAVNGLSRWQNEFSLYRFAATLRMRNIYSAKHVTHTHGLKKDTGEKIEKVDELRKWGKCFHTYLHAINAAIHANTHTCKGGQTDTHTPTYYANSMLNFRFEQTAYLSSLFRIPSHAPSSPAPCRRNQLCLRVAMITCILDPLE